MSGQIEYPSIEYPSIEYPSIDTSNMKTIIQDTIPEIGVEDTRTFWETIIIIVRYTIAILLMIFVGYNIYINVDTCYPGLMPKYNNKIRRVVFGDDTIANAKSTDLAKELKTKKSKSSGKPSPIKPSKKDLVSVSDEKEKYCYIGNEGGNRSCVDIKNSYKCMSGEIFPTMEACLKPTIGQ